MALQNGEKEGLVITLMSSSYKVFIDFGVVLAVRMLDEGIVLNELFDDEQIRAFRDKEFDNTIYQIINGEFDSFIKKQEEMGRLFTVQTLCYNFIKF